MRILFITSAILVHASLCAGWDSFNILIAFPSVEPKERVPFYSMGKQLADAGHHVTLLSSAAERLDYPLVEDIGVNVKDLWDQYLMLPNEGPEISHEEVLEICANVMWKSSSAKLLYRNRHSFDAVILPMTGHDYCLPFLRGSNATLITFSNLGVDPVNMADKSGHWMSMAATPVMDSRLPRIMSLGQRIDNVYKFFKMLTYKWYTIRPMMSNLVEKYFPDLDIYEIRDTHYGLTLINCHHSVCGQVPLLPSQVEVGAFHIDSHSRIKDDKLREVVESSFNDIIYMNIGNDQRREMTLDKLNLLREVFSRSQATVIWNYYGGKRPEQVPQNVFLVNDMNDQQAIMAHQKTKLFISDCSTNGVLEAVYFWLPVLSIPRTPQQHQMMQRLLDLNVTIQLDWESLEEFEFADAIRTLMKDIYHIKMKSASNLFRHRELSPSERLLQAVETSILYKDPASEPVRGLHYSPMLQTAIVYSLLMILIPLILLSFIKRLFDYNYPSGGNENMVPTYKQ